MTTAERPVCVEGQSHHWLVDTAGVIQHGVCKRCEAERDFNPNDAPRQRRGGKAGRGIRLKGSDGWQK